jgi:hypothetical protein
MKTLFLSTKSFSKSDGRTAKHSGKPSASTTSGPEIQLFLLGILEIILRHDSLKCLCKQENSKSFFEILRSTSWVHSLGSWTVDYTYGICNQSSDVPLESHCLEPESRRLWDHRSSHLSWSCWIAAGNSCQTT